MPDPLSLLTLGPRKPIWLDAHPLPFVAPVWRAIVTLPWDGDTFHCVTDEGERKYFYRTVRVYGINAPELDTAEGKAALKFAKTFCAVGALVTLELIAVDKYGGRYDGRVRVYQPATHLWVDFADTMLEAGHAVIYNP